MKGARRELAEETGITQIQTVSDFEIVLEYPVKVEREAGEIVEYEKRTHLFLARAESTDWSRSPEHDDGAWMPGELALARLQHADLKDALLRAMAVLGAGGAG